MNRFFSILAISLASLGTSLAKVKVNEDEFGKELGGWTKRGKQAAEYAHSGAVYRTYRPEITPTPDGGIFISLRIDHVRGWLASDDHAVLEITVDKKGNIVAAQSNIAIQGQAITSEVIKGGTAAGQQLVGVDRAVQIGTDLIADLSEKMLREKIVEAGRVSFPAVLRHNYNLLFQAVHVVKEETPAVAVVVPEPDQPAADPKEPAKAEEKPKPDAEKSEKAPENPKAAKLEIKPYGTPTVDLPTTKQE
ncbi:hypothetical protein JIN85_10770 [Luteolibacter pohnpeiensis]|uniref:Uncharacterized protein n=1 Tax=Luteolibacter pohnpeiensis TaxID=454153 RepID=A0A934S8Q1_9BACT|nr:hypothetical protein [Luteolibacter pohnpeiensis]MBK1882901.1 hypothetical protein [Luteolibacter pohnpeiensis]